MTVDTNPAAAPPPARSLRPMRLAALGLIALYATYFSFYTCIAHGRLKTYAFDLGTFDQGIWLAGHGTNYFVTVRGLHLLGDHVRLFSFVLAPLYWIWDDVRALLVLQTIVIAAAAWLLLRIAEQKVPRHRWFALAVAASWLLHPAVQNLNLDHAHPDAFATTLLVASVWFLRRGHLLGFWTAAILATSCKEDVPLVFVAMGLVLMLDRSRRRLGTALLAVSAGYFALCMLVILPHFNGVGFFRFDEQYFLGGVGAHHTDLSWIYQRLVRIESVTYLVSLGAPLLFLFMLAPLSVAPAIPALLANLLSDAGYMRSFQFHYQTSVLPFLYIGAIDGFAFAVDWLRERHADRASRTVSWLVPAAFVVAVVAENIAWSRIPIPRMGDIVGEWKFLRADPELAQVQRVLSKIPPDAAVSADYSLVPQLAHRPLIYMFPNPFRINNWGIDGENTHDPETVEYVVVRDIPGHPPVRQNVDTVLDARRFRLIRNDRSTSLYQRIKRVPLSEHASCGDWDGDGKVTLEDVQWIAEAIMTGRECPLAVCDANGSGKTENADVLSIGKRARSRSYALACPPPAGP